MSVMLTKMELCFLLYHVCYYFLGNNKRGNPPTDNIKYNKDQKETIRVLQIEMSKTT
jgi:hypothetical protein